MSSFKAALVLVLGFAWLQSALAQSVPGTKLPLMGFSNSASTSTCIGDPVTPLCAVETFEACRRRAEWPLCAEVGVDHHLRAIAERFGLEGGTLLPFHEAASSRAVVK